MLQPVVRGVEACFVVGSVLLLVGNGVEREVLAGVDCMAVRWRACRRLPSGRNTSLSVVVPDIKPERDSGTFGKTKTEYITKAVIATDCLS